MKFEERFSKIWNNIPFIVMPEAIENSCLYARGFSSWGNQLIKEITEPNIVAVNQAKLQLLDKYFEWYRYVPRAHRLRAGTKGHICVFQVFESAYERLKVLELSLTPPMLFLPTVVSPINAHAQIVGLFIGEDEQKLKEKEENE